MPDSHQKSEKNTDGPAERILSGMFLVGVAGVSLLFGFGRSFAGAKKREKTVDLHVGNRLDANALALRALGWGTVLAFTGVGFACYGIWKIMGVKDLQEFRYKAGSLLPRIPKKENPGARTEFENLTELFQYIIDEDNKKKNESQFSTTENSSKQGRQEERAER